MSESRTATVPMPQGTASILHQLMEVARLSALAEMASGIAHIMNQPLGAIATFAQAGERLLNRPEPQVDRALDVLRQINAEALEAGENIRKIRRLFEQRPLRRMVCDYGEVVEEMRPWLEGLAERHGVRLDIELPASLPPVSIDRLRIQHVLLALVQNAIDASAGKADQPSVSIRATAERNALETSITDSGAGVPDSIRDQLFRPFFTTKPHGTGLGLASVRAIIQSHDGTVGFESTSGEGSRFWFRLPIES